ASDQLGAGRALPAFAQLPAVAALFARRVEAAFAAARSRLMARAGLTAFTIFLVVAGTVAILWCGSRLVVGGQMTGGRLRQFVLYAPLPAAPMAQLAEGTGGIAPAAGAPR